MAERCAHYWFSRKPGYNWIARRQTMGGAGSLTGVVIRNTVAKGRQRRWWRYFARSGFSTTWTRHRSTPPAISPLPADSETPREWR